MTKDLLAARRYAQALFEIARDMHKDAEIEAELDSLSAALKRSPEIERFLASPALKTEQKSELLQRMYSERNKDFYEILMNFFRVLFEKQRFHLVHEIAVEFKRIADEAQGQGVAELQSATPLKAEAQKRIVERLERMAGYKITVKNTIDPSLIGGVVVKVRNKVIDGSLKDKIQKIRKELTKAQSI